MIMLGDDYDKCWSISVKNAFFGDGYADGADFEVLIGF